MSLHLDIMYSKPELAGALTGDSGYHLLSLPPSNLCPQDSAAGCGVPDVIKPNNDSYADAATGS